MFENPRRTQFHSLNKMLDAIFNDRMTTNKFFFLSTIKEVAKYISAAELCRTNKEHLNSLAVADFPIGKVPVLSSPFYTKHNVLLITAPR